MVRGTLVGSGTKIDVLAMTIGKCSGMFREGQFLHISPGILPERTQCLAHQDTAYIVRLLPFPLYRRSVEQVHILW